MATAHDFAFTAIDGATLPLANVNGKAMPVVNTASECGDTPRWSYGADFPLAAKAHGPDGERAAWFPTNVSPTAKAVTVAIEETLA